MKPVVKAAAFLILVSGTWGYAEEFAGADFYENLRTARQELRGGGEPLPGVRPEAVDFAADDAPAASVKDWTVMVFINGKNDLEMDGLDDINEMERVGSTENINVVVELGRLSTNRLERYYVARDTAPAQITSRVLSSARAVDMGDPASVRDFVLWAERRFPARKYLLVLWDHGNGWLKGNPAGAPAGEAKGISDDWTTGHNIDTPQLGRLFRDIEAAGGRVDLLAMDACLMQVAEVAYELKDSRISHVAASEEIEPGGGYAYHRFLAPLAQNPGMEAGALATVIAQEYLNEYPAGFAGRVGLTYSVVEPARMGELGARMDALARAAMTANDKEAVRRARDGATRYDIEDNKDLRHFARLLRRESASPEVQAAAAALDAALEAGSGPVAFTGVSANRPTESFGLAAYVPGSNRDIRGYGELKLSADTQWDEFVAWLLQP